MLARAEDDATLGGYERVCKGDSVSTKRPRERVKLRCVNGLSMISVCVEIYCLYFNVHHHHHHPSAAEQAITRFLHARRSSANAAICCSCIAPS